MTSGEWVGERGVVGEESGKGVRLSFWPRGIVIVLQRESSVSLTHLVIVAFALIIMLPLVAATGRRAAKKVIEPQLAEFVPFIGGNCSIVCDGRFWRGCCKTLICLMFLKWGMATKPPLFRTVLIQS